MESLKMSVLYDRSSMARQRLVLQHDVRQGFVERPDVVQTICL